MSCIFLYFCNWWYRKARETIQRLVAKIQGGPLDDEDGGTTGQIELMVPGGKVGLIIGKSGETIKQIQVCEYWNVYFHVKLHVSIYSSCCSCIVSASI